MDGIININKPLGITSQGVVSRVKRILNIKKAGHTGTLDPDAQGVLPVCVGKGTKAAGMLTDSGKQYRAVMKLGIVTDTQDATGAVLEQKEVNCTNNEIYCAVNSFIGDIEQIPPMYSAVKINGKKLYELARKGVSVERKPRMVHIESIQVEKIENDEVTMLVDCSKGTYIRTLCNDIGSRLGCGGIMQSLVRTRVGRFSIEDAVTFEQLEKSGGEKYLVSLNDIFDGYPEVRIDKNQEQKVRNGIRIRTDKASGTYRIQDENGELLCISRAENGFFIMEKSFYG